MNARIPKHTAPASRSAPPRSWARVLIASLSLLLLFPMSAGAQSRQATPEETAAAIVRPAIVYLDIYWSAYVQDHEGDWLNGGGPYDFAWSCTGFVVNPGGYIATAGHCVDDGLEGAAGTAIGYGIEEWIANGWATEADRAALSELAYVNWRVEGEGSGTPADRTVYVQHGAATSGMQTGQAWPARVVEYKPVTQGDVALLKVEETNLPTVLLASDADVNIGTSVLSVGYPASSDWVTDASYEPTYKDGKISSKKTREGGLLPVYEISAAVSPGMSGGPTVNTDGEVVGVNSFGIMGEPQAFNFLSPSSLVTEMMARNGVVNELGPVDELYRTAIASYFAGNYAQAMDEFDLVLDRSPSHQQAQEYRAQAAQQAPLEPETPAPTEEPSVIATQEPVAEEGGGFPILPVAIGAGVVVAALVAFLLLRGRGKAAPPTAPSAPMPPPVAAPMPPTPAPPAEMPVPTAAAPPIVLPEAAPTAPPPEAASPSAPHAPHFCEECGELVSPTAKFCAACGATIAHPVEH
jgi:serine protease Do